MNLVGRNFRACEAFWYNIPRCLCARLHERGLLLLHRLRTSRTPAMSDQLDKLCAAIARAEARAPPPMAANDAIRLYVDLCQVVDPIKTDGLRTLLQELTAKKTARADPVRDPGFPRAGAGGGWRGSVASMLREAAPAAATRYLDPPRPAMVRTRVRPARRPMPRGGATGAESLKADGRCRGPGGRRRSAARATDATEMARPARARPIGAVTGVASKRRQGGSRGQRDHALRAVRIALCEGRDRPAGGGLALRLVPRDNWPADARAPKSQHPLQDVRRTAQKRQDRPALGHVRVPLVRCDLHAPPIRRPHRRGRALRLVRHLLRQCVGQGQGAPRPVEKGSSTAQAEVERLTSENKRLASVPVIDAETGAETRERPPKRAREDADAAPPPSSLQREKAQRDAFPPGQAREGGGMGIILCTVRMEAGAPRTVLFGPCSRASPAPRAPKRSQESPGLPSTHDREDLDRKLAS